MEGAAACGRRAAQGPVPDGAGARIGAYSILAPEASTMPFHFA